MAAVQLPDRVGEEGLAQHSFFVPMVDLLAGVVFLLVIMLAASVLVSRPDFGTAQAMQAELQRISAELDAARAAEKLLLDPRRQADADLRLLLGRLKSRLAGGGLAVEDFPEAGRLSVREGTTVGGADAGLAALVADALVAEMPCLAAGSATNAKCDGYGAATLETVEVAAPMRSDQSATDARAASLQLLSEIAARQPSLLSLAGQSGAPILTYGAGSRIAAGDDRQVELEFAMRLPAIP